MASKLQGLNCGDAPKARLHFDYLKGAFPEYLFGGPYDKAASILGSMLGSSYSGKRKWNILRLHGAYKQLDAEFNTETLLLAHPSSAAFWSGSPQSIANDCCP